MTLVLCVIVFCLGVVVTFDTMNGWWLLLCLGAVGVMAETPRPGRQSHQERYGYPIWLPLGMVVALIGFPVSILKAFASGEWRWLGITAILALFAWVLSRA